jgi:hypothetical protein
MIKIACVVAGFAVAALAATSAHAAKPLSVKQKNEMAEAMARNHQQAQARGKAKAAPKTMAQAAAAQTEMGNGMVEMQIPEELHNYLSVQSNADGSLRIVETDGDSQPVLKTAEVSNEK